MRSKFAIYAVLVALVGALAPACDRSNGTDDSTGEQQAAGDRSSSEVVAVLADEDATTEERLRAIHRARDQKIDAAAPKLIDLLDADNPDIVVAAAAALAKLDAPQADTAVVEAAGRLSRARLYESLRQMLFIVGEVGGPASRTYLEAVAEGHQVPAIRDTAKQVLETMNPGNQP